VTTFYYRDVLGWQPIHQDRPIGVVEGRALCCGEQLQWHRTSLHERVEVPPLGSKESGDPFDIEPWPILNRVIRVSTRPHRVLLQQREDGPRRIRLSDPYGFLHPRGGVAELQRPSKTRRIFDHYTIAEVLLEAHKSQRHDRAERMTSQNIHRARYLGEDVLRHIRHVRSAGPAAFRNPWLNRSATCTRHPMSCRSSLSRHQVSWLDCTPWSNKIDRFSVTRLFNPGCPASRGREYRCQAGQ
jgi:hypothetical protein